MTVQWQVTEMTAYTERGVYTLQRDRHGVWELSFLPRHREWPAMMPVQLVKNAENGDVVDFANLEDALMFAERHSASFEPQMQRAAGC